MEHHSSIGTRLIALERGENKDSFTQQNLCAHAVRSLDGVGIPDRRFWNADPCGAVNCRSAISGTTLHEKTVCAQKYNLEYGQPGMVETKHTHTIREEDFVRVADPVARWQGKMRPSNLERRPMRRWDSPFSHR